MISGRGPDCRENRSAFSGYPPGLSRERMCYNALEMGVRKSGCGECEMLS
jgi:hypothetical protein